MSSATVQELSTVQQLATLESMGIYTVVDLGDYAHERGMTPSELLARVAAGLN